MQGEVEQALEELGRVGKGNSDAMGAVQEFLRKEKRMPLRILAIQTIVKIKKFTQPTTEQFRSPIILTARVQRR
jgi:glutathione synthase/RimK-type ligase-like ATP-grasp enzyme